MIQVLSGLWFPWAGGGAAPEVSDAVETWSHPWTVRDDVYFSYPVRVRNDIVEQGHTESSDPAEDTS